MTFKAIIKSPLVHFFLLGGLIFAAYTAKDKLRSAYRKDEIVLSFDKADQMVSDFEKAENRRPTQDEVKAMMFGWVDEEVLMRQAIKLGLAENDSIVRLSLSDKMRKMLTAEAGSLKPDDAILQDFMNAHKDYFVDQDGKLPPFAEIRQKVLKEWRADEGARLVRNFTQELLSDYKVRLPDPQEVLNPQEVLKP